MLVCHSVCGWLFIKRYLYRTIMCWHIIVCVCGGGSLCIKCYLYRTSMCWSIIVCVVRFVKSVICTGPLCGSLS